MLELRAGNRPWFTITRGAGPLIATAIHAGHGVRPEVVERMALDDAGRLREEDPFTDLWAEVAATRVIGHRSRFEVDLNRPRQRAVYRTPEDAWGLEVWRQPPSDQMVEDSLSIYDAFYSALGALFDQLAERHGRLLVLDLHSYNHRRQGAGAAPADPAGNPEINIGTGPHPEDGRWRPLVDRFIAELSAQKVAGHALDVRETVKFDGGQLARWSHEHYADQVCVLAVEMKKTFMDEWTGEPDASRIAELSHALSAASAVGLEVLDCE